MLEYSILILSLKFQNFSSNAIKRVGTIPGIWDNTGSISTTERVRRGREAAGNGDCACWWPSGKKCHNYTIHYPVIWIFFFPLSLIPIYSGYFLHFCHTSIFPLPCSPTHSHPLSFPISPLSLHLNWIVFLEKAYYHYHLYFPPVNTEQVWKDMHNNPFNEHSPKELSTKTE